MKMTLKSGQRAKLARGFWLICLGVASMVASAQSPFAVRWNNGDPFPPRLEWTQGEPLPSLVNVTAQQITQLCTAQVEKSRAEAAWWKRGTDSDQQRQIRQCEVQKAADYSQYEQQWYAAKKIADEDIKQVQKAAADRRWQEEQVALAKQQQEKQAEHDAWARETEAAAEKHRIEMEKEQQEIDAQEAAAHEKEITLKAECGADYRNPRVGMSIARAKHCVGPFKMVGQLNRKDGVLIDSYRYCRGYACVSASVIEGQIVFWEKL